MKNVVATAFILLHLSVIVAIPNPSSSLLEKLDGWVTPYANALGLHSTWSFFSIGAGPPIYLEIDVVYPEEKKTVQMPTFEDPYFWRQTYNRRVTASRFATSKPEFIENYFGPYLCGIYPGSYQIHIGALKADQASLDEANQGLSINDISRRTYQPFATFFCQTAGR